MGIGSGSRRATHGCEEHLRDVLLALAPLESRPIDVGRFIATPGEVAEWVDVELDDPPEIPRHNWRIDLADEVGAFVDPDRDDIAEFLGRSRDVTSVVQLDREVLVVEGPSLCADGLRAVVVRAISEANARVLAPTSEAVSVVDQRAAGVEAPARSDQRRAADDDNEPRLVTGAARSAAGQLQVWVIREGMLLLPAGSIPHEPLDMSDNPHYPRATFTADDVLALARHHQGRWLPFHQIANAQLRRPGLFRATWKLILVDASKTELSLSWHGTRQHAALAWAYLISGCGKERVDGTP